MKPYYEHAGIVIYHGDCRDVLPSLGPIDHVMSDPPYSDDTHEGARTSTARDTKVLVDFASTQAANIAQTLALIRLKRWAVLTCDWQHVLPLKQSPPVGWRFVRHGAWVKPNGTPQFTGDRPAQGWEAIAIFSRWRERSDALERRRSAGCLDSQQDRWLSPDRQAGAVAAGVGAAVY